MPRPREWQIDFSEALALERGSNWPDLPVAAAFKILNGIIFETRGSPVSPVASSCIEEQEASAWSMTIPEIEGRLTFTDVRGG